MSEDWLSVEQVAERLNLHVRTVRGYIRDGRLNAVRIGKQYRISPGDLAALTGQGRAQPRVEVSAVVEIEEVGSADADRISTFIVAGAQLTTGLKVRAIHDEGRRRLKVILLGSPSATADALQTLDDVMNGVLGD